MLFKRCLLLLLLTLAILTAQAKVDTLTIQSPSMQKTLKAGVATPETYKKKKNGPYPVLYLLHGYSGNFSNWLKVPPQKDLLQSMADKYNFIIVTPDGGYSSWYLDSPTDKSSQYETFITKELVQLVDSKYKTIKEKNGRFISGLSMGGHGALYLSARHPELYLAAGSMSGTVDISAIDHKNLLQSIEAVLGPKQANQQLFEENSINHLVPQLKQSGVRLIIDCGVDDFLIEDNRELHRTLVAEIVPHDYTERPGAHSWAYWSNALEYHLLFFQKARWNTETKNTSRGSN
ncbi:S-formylglutathione hydrolase FrmB [Pontibacter aydingkolensis]|uniref:Esterase family protein n=1 Tax=Pontibacter aydingkolensis TaxID=1911536 RepID=A0ABS7CRT5_9BACT|nr:alpha/beta hydrolase family protein [Pontibacter aydingkolensis]MBW7466559.1 esterase family protein [Pontibacter aydingkolensis]